MGFHFPCYIIFYVSFLFFQVPIKFVTEFHKLYAYSVCGSCESVQNIKGVV